MRGRFISSDLRFWRRLFDFERVDLLVLHPNRRIRHFRANRLNSKPLQRLEQVCKYLLPPANKAGREAAPERPPSSFENPLACHVVLPLPWPMESVAVTFDCQAAALRTLHDKVDSVPATRNLGQH